MRLEEAYRKLPEFMDGGLPDVERREMERLLDQEPALAQAFHVSQQIDDCLTRQPWLEPSPLFVQKVLAHTELAGSRLLPRWVRMWEPTKVAVSFFTLGLLLAISGKTLWKITAEGLRQTGTWLDTLIGVTLFAVNPLVVLAVIVPILVGGWAICVVSGRCRAMS